MEMDQLGIVVEESRKSQGMKLSVITELSDYVISVNWMACLLWKIV
jgi:hypothetical protein